ncbi:hypothetical protein STM14_2219 [Salmonella enterica subsp. enterica serovar Typhimurium str. 14028S]|uniref:Uncharacterized protein n=1 Tax=Salmonella typhimurium (strain 14028s / SGSC 2262) TaxID=588858 RepID=A0A0F6B2E4_SALT1|nr:hypothetical protein STM14_2219 [Salmonella enterica subsp. enterica serovar Typhimurium str. 14028S]
MSGCALVSDLLQRRDVISIVFSGFSGRFPLNQSPEK